MSTLSKRKSKAESKDVVRPFEGLQRIQPHAAGLDIGAHEIAACVANAEGQQIIRFFGTYTDDLKALAAWLAEHQVKTVAMESTGIYWIPLFEILEQCGFACCLICASAIRRIPGRKSDVLDCQWIQTLHSYGLLADSFRPDADLVALRTLLRHRAQLLEHRAPHILHMQKAMLHMNIQLSQAISDVTGETGQAIIRAIVAGQRDPHKLAELRNFRCKKSEAEIAQALTGTWREEHLFVLKQSLEIYDHYTRQIAACDTQVEQTYTTIRPDWPAPDADVLAPLPKKNSASHSKNAPNAVQVRLHLLRITGVDLLEVSGISATVAQTIVAEVGSSLQQFPSDKHFCSWLGLAPHNDISGGKVLRSYCPKDPNRAGQAFIHAAAANIRAETQFGAFYRRLKSRVGPSQALIATAHKIARVVYRMLKDKQPYRSTSASEYEQTIRQREIASLTRRAKKLGLIISEQAAVS